MIFATTNLSLPGSSSLVPALVMATRRAVRKQKQSEGPSVKAEKSASEGASVVRAAKQQDVAKIDPPPEGWMALIVFALLCFGAVVFFGVSPSHPASKPDAALARSGIITRPVPVRKWPSAGAPAIFATRTTHLRALLPPPRTPVVLRKTPADTWEARKSWTPSYFAQHAQDKKLKGVYQREKDNQDHGVFGPIWIGDKPLAHLPCCRTSVNPHKSVETSVEQFFQLSTSTSISTSTLPGGNFSYFVSAVEDLGEKFVEDILPMDAFLKTPEHSQVNVWIGSPGVVTHLHYDSYLNLNIQLYGAKRFLLFPPNASTTFKSYPFLHPSFGQSQVALTEGPPGLVSLSDALSSANEAVEAYEVVLQPGDVLYIPPCWLHQVTAETWSISVNAWSVADEANVVQ
eukprot:g57093.t1